MKPRKSDVVRVLVESENYKVALHIARKFRIGITEDEREQMCRAFECMAFPDFYRELGMDLENEIRAGIEILKQHYGKEAAA